MGCSDLARYRLGRQVLPEALRAAFAADATALDAAEGGVRCHPGKVDADAAGLDPAGNVEAVLHVAGETVPPSPYSESLAMAIASSSLS